MAGDTWLRNISRCLYFRPPARFTEKGYSTLLTPKLILEVLSRSTETYNRTRNFQSYQLIETFTDYVLIAQHVIGVEHFRRTEMGWFHTIYSRLNESLVLEIFRLGFYY
jgi:Uma2 family endonuclease